MTFGLWPFYISAFCILPCFRLIYIWPAMCENISSDKLLCAPYEVLIHPCSLISLSCPHDETLHPWLSRWAHWRFWTDCMNPQADLNLCWVHLFEGTFFWPGLGGSVGCAVRLETRRSRVQPPLRSATFFRGDWSWNIFYGHSLPSADWRRAVVSFLRKNVHNTG